MSEKSIWGRHVKLLLKNHGSSWKTTNVGQVQKKYKDTYQHICTCSTLLVVYIYICVYNDVNIHIYICRIYIYTHISVKYNEIHHICKYLYIIYIYIYVINIYEHCGK